MDHLSPRQLVDLEAGRLTDKEEAAAAAHLDTCEACRSAALTTQDAAGDALLARLREPPGDEYAEEVQRAAALEAAAAMGVTDQESAVSTSDDTGNMGTADRSRSDVRPADDAELFGRRFGEYEVLRKIGAGGMGQVFEARHGKMKRIVALKTLPASTVQTPEAKKRFLREVETAARLIHPHIVVAYDAGESDGTPYLVMEYVAGRDLSSIVREEGPRSVRQAVEECLQAARGLAYAHARGVVHRDVKPGNLLLDSQGTVKILDMGLARLDDQAEVLARGEEALARGEIEELTQTGQMMGTVDYMAPEQALDVHRADAKADVYSLGCTLYRLLTGKPPYAGETFARKIAAHREQPIPSPAEKRADVPPRLDAFFRRMVAKQPADRPTMAEVVAELERIGAAIGAGGRPPFKPWQIAAAAGAAALLAWVIIVKIKDKNGGVIAEIRSENGVSVTSSDGVRTPTRAVAPFPAADAAAHQRAWAEHLGLPVEYENDVGMQFRLIPPGEFTRGTARADAEELAKRLGDHPTFESMRVDFRAESPPHRVLLTEPFYFSAYEVTQAQYAAVTGLRPAGFSPQGSQKQEVVGFDTDQFPVESVTWDEAVKFCDLLSGRERHAPYYGTEPDVSIRAGPGYRLPTEAQWEFACRAGTTTKYWTGDSWQDVLRAAWCFPPSNQKRPTTVGSLAPNPFGLYDIHGNVREFCNDGWSPDTYLAYADKTAVNPDAPWSTPLRVARGGHWFLGPLQARSACRFRPRRDLRNLDNGIRPVLSVEAVRTALGRPPSPQGASTAPSASPTGSQPAPSSVK